MNMAIYLLERAKITTGRKTGSIRQNSLNFQRPQFKKSRIGSKVGFLKSSPTGKCCAISENLESGCQNAKVEPEQRLNRTEDVNYRLLPVEGVSENHIKNSFPIVI